MIVASLASAWAWGPIGEYVAPDPGSEQAEAARAALEKVPDDAVVSAHYSYVPHLAHREEIYEFPVPWKARNWGAFEQEGQRLDFAGRIEIVVVAPDSLSAEEGAILEDIRADFSTIHDQGGILVLSRTVP